MNVLLLKGKVRLAPMLEMVTSEQLMAYLGDCVFESMPQVLASSHVRTESRSLQCKLLSLLGGAPDLPKTELVVADFEYTPECIIFDLLEIGLYHGWLVDPQDSQSVAAVSKCSYNQLVEKIIQQKASDKDELIREAEQFLDRTASQLTYHGLCELSLTVKEHELSIFFRNNHFSTLYRHNNFSYWTVKEHVYMYVYQVALSLHQDQQMIAEQEAAWGQFHPEMAAAHNGEKRRTGGQLPLSRNSEISKVKDKPQLRVRQLAVLERDDRGSGMREMIEKTRKRGKM
nr:hypothetical protein BaRGS_034667 [Batillaria attramentaria]